MNKYLIILPHAGAIRSSYSSIEDAAANSCKIIYIDYANVIDYKTEKKNFENLTNHIVTYIRKNIKDRNAAIYIIGHSMGGTILQAIETKIYNEFYLEKVIYSDCFCMDDIDSHELRKKSETEITDMIKDEYNLNKELYQNSELLPYFQNKLKADLMIMDTVPEVKYRHIGLTENKGIQRVLVCSEYIDLDRFQNSWEKCFELDGNVEIVKIPGDHYAVLNNFDEKWIQ
jgi:surfactin synthase thioesterase subunit